MTEPQPDVVVDNVVVTVDRTAEWVYLRHPGFGGTTRIPNDEAALESHRARGWEVAEPPGHVGPAVPNSAGGPVSDDGEWVDMVHPGFGGRQRLPNNAAALSGARDAGWVTATEVAAIEVETLTVAAVLEAVGEDPVRASAALASERDGKNRASLIRALEAIAEGATPTAPQDEEI